jgi:hypothetical protein
MGSTTLMLESESGTNKPLARQIVDDGIRRYFADRRGLVKSFVDRNFSLKGSLKLHRQAVGWDIARAPFNLTMAIPQIGLLLAGRAASKLGGIPRRCTARQRAPDGGYRRRQGIGLAAVH